MEENMYLCIDLKSFYASVECVDRGLDPMTTNLAVADPDRGEGTICLAISPAMKSLGIKNRCRVYEIPKNVEYLKAPPRMRRYIQYSADIYGIYLKYFAKEDIHVFSIDEAFFYVNPYLSLYGLTAKELAQEIMADVLTTTGITAAAGIGTNLYLAKVALDILAKHAEDNIAFLDEGLYRKKLWRHKPLTDFFRVGTGIMKRLSHAGLITMEDVAFAEEEPLYRMFGVDAELLIDHAWGRESVTIEDIKSYVPKHNSLSSSQVLLRDYSFEEGGLILKEMTDNLCLSMLEKGVAARSVSLSVGYSYETEIKPASGTVSMHHPENSYMVLIPYLLNLYERITRRDKPIRKFTLTCSTVPEEGYRQYNLFSHDGRIDRDKKLQRAALEIKHRYGKNALFRGMDLLEAGTARERNNQIGGHKSGG
ncbi:DNA repair protein [Lachnospiraceae bacterium 38-14]|jgi:Nucleotidyltransferase/DNA polymerase involved in DNA repair